MDCPDADEVLAFLKGALEPGAAAALERHVDGCEDCRLLLSELVRSKGAPGAGGHTQLDTDAELDPTAAAQTRLLRPGGRVGPYQVTRVLGIGGMGVVYGARDESGRDVAIKMLRRSFRDQPEMRARFLREAELMRSLSHPNLVRVFDAGELEGFPWLAMELVDGTTLEELQRAQGWRETLGQYLEAAAGLAAAHQRGIVHRDFKAANVLVPERGEAKLTDFGVAHAQGSSLTRKGQVLGTLHYLAPESLMEAKFTPATDQFAFAVSAWRGLYGVRPFDGATPEEVLRAIVKAEPRLPPEPRGVPVEVEAVLRRALSREPSQRWPSMAALAGELARAARPSGSVFGPIAIAAGLALAAAVWFGFPRGGDAELDAVRALAREGRSLEALAAAQAAAAKLEQLPGERAPRAQGLAGVLLALGRAELAEALATRELAASPEGALVLARAAYEQGHAAEAAARYERAVSLWAQSASRPPGALEYAKVQRDAVAGSAELPASVDALARAVPAGDLRLAAARLWLGEAALKAGDFDAAAQPLEQAAAAFDAALGRSNAAAARARAGLAEVELAKGAVEPAEAHAAQALKLRAAALGEAHPELAREWSVLAWAALRRHDSAASKRALEQAAALGARSVELGWRADEARAVAAGSAAGGRRLSRLLAAP